MSIIVYDGYSIGADNVCTQAYSGVQHETVKLHQLSLVGPTVPIHALAYVGTTGSPLFAKTYLRHLRGDVDPLWSPRYHQNFTEHENFGDVFGFFVYHGQKEKGVHLMFNSGDTQFRPTPFFAFGSSDAFAMGCLASGKTTLETLELCKQHTAFINGDFTIYQI